MNILSYTTKLEGSKEDLQSLIKLLEQQRDAFNLASRMQFKQKQISIVLLHKKSYRKIRKLGIMAQVAIRGELECLAKYRSTKSNKHKCTKPHEKTRLSIQLDKRLYSLSKDNKINISTVDKRKSFSIKIYTKLQEMFNKYKFGDPSLFVKNGEIHICFPFKIEVEKQPQKLALGVDLGVRVAAACSDGRLIKDSKFNGRKRKLRHLKDKLKSCGTKSSKRHLRKIRHKERNINKNQTHLLANEILNTKCDTICLENLKGIKAKKHKVQNKNAISQVSLYELRRVITYKALLRGMTVVLVSPAYTSQTDSLTGRRDGIRKGRRYYSKSGLIYDADINAAINIAKRSNLPVSQILSGKLLSGQAVVNRPNVCKAASVLQVQSYLNN